MDESLRRLGGILASPSLLLHYEHTTPALERGYLRRIGLSRAEQDAFMDYLCRTGRLDEGARALLEAEAFRRGCAPGELARQLLAEQPPEEKWEDG